MNQLRALIACIIVTTHSLLIQSVVAQDVPTHQRYSETVFATTLIENGAVNQSLAQGACTFLMDKNMPDSAIEHFFKSISSFLSSHPKAIITAIVEKPINAIVLKKWLSANELTPLLYIKSSTEDWPLLSEMIAKNKRLVIFTVSPCTNCFLLNKNLFFNNFSTLVSNQKTIALPNNRALLCYSPFSDGKTQLTEQDSTFQYRAFLPWKLRGIKPNFLVSSHAMLSKCIEVAAAMNATVKYGGEVRFNNKILNDIRWMNTQVIVTDGVFSFPASKKNYDLYTPWKEGYKFYPEVVKYDGNHRFQEFVATKFELDDDLVYHMSFENKSENTAEPREQKNLVFNTRFVSGSTHGKVAVFDNESAAIQCNKNTNFDTNKAFTISVWVKPYKVDAIHTIVSKGQVFSAKIRKGGLSFAGTGFRSRITSIIRIKANEWQHLTWVCVPNYHVQFFVNGKLQEEMEFETLMSSDQSITIGNNFSNEAYKGEMDELQIWNRALSADEIAEVYQLKTNSHLNMVLMIGVSGLLLLLMGILFSIWKKRGKKKLTSISSTGLKSSMSKQAIAAFGSFSIINEQGEELAQQLSPKVKQLLLLLIIHKDGLSISRLNQELWPGVDEEKAKQNRNYCIQQLKKTLAKMNDAALEYQAKKWVLTIGTEISVDIIEHEKLASLMLSASMYDTIIATDYLTLVERGKCLQGIEIEAFDQYKAKMSDLITECLLHLSINADSKTRLRLGNALLLHDSLQEDGLRIALKSLTELGRNGEAHDIYNSFCKKYKNTYNEDFSSTFSSFI